MRKITLATLSLLLATPVFATENTSINYNMVNIQAEASKDVHNDQMYAVLYIEKSSPQATALATQITQAMNQATALGQKYPEVKMETGQQSTYPIYDNDSQKLKEWRGRAEVRLTSTDFKAVSQLMSALQNTFQTESIQFNVSDQQRQLVENELMVMASQNFQKRAQLIAQTWQKNKYHLVNLDLRGNEQSFIQPRMLMASSKMMAASAPAQNFNAGDSKVSVTASGTIQLD
ncbi:SIMPL domain-containing protein [Acinetobacter rathckeae]|uniref:SIMPL domain-containing protein n=1 Tax=Acinetobacter rathckeae TaxID=2605272 RepID=UPI0018A24EB9|nr:SIMPL domain-containing protein [Acinetobacter rathckeae]MBF7686944.1 SIMPL domain-containing protein [Acinetobacter rathckeae]MBF7694652.1 SIMPL domain-containing protein [Acinetobacter rathckeae]